MPTDADVLDKQIKELEHKGRQGQQQVCQAAEKLQGCLGSQYDECISVAYLKSIGESDKDAKKFVEISKKLEKECVQINLATDENKCTDVIFGLCTGMFANALGLPQFPTDPSILDKQIKQDQAKGKEGKTQVCNAAGNLVACMEPAYSDCISVDYFKKIGESDTDAAKFVSIIQTQVTQCAQVGLAVVAKCEKQRLFKCADEFNKALHLKTPKDPNELDREIKELEKRGEKPQLCRATKKFESCLGPELKECISVEFLKSLGLSDKDAKGYVHIFYQELQAQCKNKSAWLSMLNAKSNVFSNAPMSSIMNYIWKLQKTPTIWTDKSKN